MERLRQSNKQSAKIVLNRAQDCFKRSNEVDYTWLLLPTSP